MGKMMRSIETGIRHNHVRIPECLKVDQEWRKIIVKLAAELTINLDHILQNSKPESTDKLEILMLNCSQSVGIRQTQLYCTLSVTIFGQLNNHSLKPTIPF